MIDRNLYSTHRKNQFLTGLQPKELYFELLRYQKLFGEGFRLENLLDIKKMESRTLVVDVVNE